MNLQTTTKSDYMIVLSKLGKWIAPDNRELPERELEQYPTYFSIRLGVYKLVPVGN